MRRRQLARLALLALAAAQLRATARADVHEARFLRIATGSVTGTYYPIGGLIAGLLSSPPGARPCAPDDSCGVPGLIAIVQSSNGSVANIEAIREGAVETGFAQSDVVHGAFTGTGVFAGQPPVPGLRALASLYLESMHLVAAPDSGIASVGDLRGRRVSLDVEGSGTLVDAKLVLESFGIRPEDIEAVNVPPAQAIGMMRAGELDAMFFVGGYPAPAISELVTDVGAKLAPILGAPIDKLLEDHRFLSRDVIPGGAYPGLEWGTPTISVAALWVTSAEMEDELANALVRALWHPGTRKALAAGHPRGRDIRLETALRGVAIPVHPGAAAFYNERGIAE